MRWLRAACVLLTLLVCVGHGPRATAWPAHGRVCTAAVAGAGDSIMLATTPTLLTSFLALTATAMGVSVFNEGHNSIGWNYDGVGGGNLTARAAAEIDPLRTSAPCPPPYLVLFAGTNDLCSCGGNSTAAQTYAFFQTYIAARQSAGWAANTKVIVVTTLPRTGVDNTQRAIYNGDLVTGAATYGYALARVDLDPNIGCDSCNTNLTYYQNDGGTHPNQTGQQIIANIVCLAMNLPSYLTCPVY